MNSSMPKIHITSLIALLAIPAILAAGVFVMAPVAWASPSCSLLPQNGRTIVNIGATLVWGSGGLNETSDISVAIPTGTYDITLVSYDDHTAETQTQPSEQWTLHMKTADGGTAGVSNLIGDLPDGQNDITQTVNLHYYIAGPIASVTARHAIGYDQSNNSITAVCVAFDRNDGAPLVTTNAAEVGNDSATLVGVINPNGSSDTFYWFDWGPNSTFGLKTNEQQIWSRQSVADHVAGLKRGTTYYFRAAARNVVGTSYGPTLTFTTLGVDTRGPFVSTNRISNINDTSMQLNGFVNPNGTQDTVYWFGWGTGPYLGAVTSQVSLGSSGRAISENLTGLGRGITYYVRAYAKNGYGTSEGELITSQTLPFQSSDSSFSSFSTYGYGSSNSSSNSSSNGNGNNSSIQNSLTAFTQLPTFVTQSAAVFNGRVVGGDTHVQTSVWFEWGTSPSLGSQTQKRSAGYVNSADFSDSIIGLSPKTFYYFRAVAEDPRMKSYGAVFVFRTSPVGLPETSTPLITTYVRPVSISGSGSGSHAVSSFTDGLGLIAITITPSDETLQVGKNVALRVTFETKTKDILSDVALNITLSPELSYQTMSGSPNALEKNAVFNIGRRVITVPVGDMAAGDKGAIDIQALLKPDTPNQKIFTTMAEVTYVDSATQAGGKDHVFAINTATNAGFAAVIFAGAWWLWLLLGLLGLLLLLWLLLWRKRRKDEEEEKKK